ncbi:MAG: cation transporter [Betaproteobacteria bacterium]|nr:cation transporter [Betaproteobacteria bacterium]
MHDHDHSHGSTGHSPGEASPGRGRFALAALLNLAFVGAEAWYGFASNSLALIADAGHNLGDVVGLLLAWGAASLAGAAPSAQRTYGLRRTSIFAALANAILLLVVVGAIAWEALGRLLAPEPLAPRTVIAVAALGVLVNGGTALLFASGRRADLNVRGAFLHMLGDAAVSLAVVISAAAILATGWLWLDPAASLAVCAVIIWGAWRLLRESTNLALDAVPSHIDAQAVERYLASLPGVSGVHDLHIWAMSTTDVALTAHIVMPEPPPDDCFLGELCQALGERFGIGHVTVQLERGDPFVFCKQSPETAL